MIRLHKLFVHTMRRSAAPILHRVSRSRLICKHSSSPTRMAGPSRTVHCCDALDWLSKTQQSDLQGCSFITSLPDISELQGHQPAAPRQQQQQGQEQQQHQQHQPAAPQQQPQQQQHQQQPQQQHQHKQHLSLPEYKAWFVSTAQLILRRCPDDGVTIFFQTDIKVDGTLLPKAYLLQRAAEDTGHALLWHKVVCRVPPGEVSWGRPAYHHMLCFSKSVRTAPAAATADVLPSAGEKTWTRGMGTAACAAACRFVLQHVPGCHTVVDPFCGHGTVLAVANELGLSAIGVEIGRKRAKQARLLSAAGLQLSRFGGKQAQAQQQQQQQAVLEEGEEEKEGVDGTCPAPHSSSLTEPAQAPQQQQQQQQQPAGLAGS